MTLTFYISVAKVFKVIVRKLAANSFVEVTKEKLIGEPFWVSPP